MLVDARYPEPNEVGSGGPSGMGSSGNNYGGPVDVGSWGGDYTGPLDVGSWGQDCDGAVMVAVPVAKFHKLFEMCYKPAAPGCVRRCDSSRSTPVSV